MNAKKLTLTMSALVLGLTSCGGNNGLTRKEAYTKLDEIVAATPEAQTKLTSVNNTMADVTANGVTTKAGTRATYVFDATTNYAHVIIGSAKTVTITYNGEKKTLPLGAGNELFAYKTSDSYVFGIKTEEVDEETSQTTVESRKITIPSTSLVSYAAAEEIMANFAQTQINAFVKCGREHWHNGAGGLSAYLKRQDTLDANKEDVVVGSETIQAGATETNHSHIVLKDEKYTSTGTGNLTLDFDALYPNPDHPEKLHEPLKFEFNNNILTHWYNKKDGNYAGNEWTMNYGTAANTLCDYAETDSVAIAAGLAATVPLAIAALVAADQPTDNSVLYTTKWGK